MTTELETSLSWVTFSEEDHGDACENLAGCSNEAVYRVTWLNACCFPKTSCYCHPCMHDPPGRRVLAGEMGICPRCRGPQQMISVRPIRTT